MIKLMILLTYITAYFATSLEQSNVKYVKSFDTLGKCTVEKYRQEYMYMKEFCTLWDDYSDCLNLVKKIYNCKRTSVKALIGYNFKLVKIDTSECAGQDSFGIIVSYFNEMTECNKALTSEKTECLNRHSNVYCQYRCAKERQFRYTRIYYLDMDLDVKNNLRTLSC